MPAMTPRSIRNRTDERKERDKKHLLNPQPGDCWSEHAVAIAVVVAVEPDRILVCFHKKSVGPNHWTWDLSKMEVLGSGQFSARLSYKATGEPYAYVTPGAHIWVVDEPEVLQYWKDNNNRIGTYTDRTEVEERGTPKALLRKYLPSGTNWGQPVTPAIVQFVIDSLKKEQTN